MISGLEKSLNGDVSVELSLSLTFSSEAAVTPFPAAPCQMSLSLAPVCSDDHFTGRPIDADFRKLRTTARADRIPGDFAFLEYFCIRYSLTVAKPLRQLSLR